MSIGWKEGRGGTGGWGAARGEGCESGSEEERDKILDSFYFRKKEN